MPLPVAPVADHPLATLLAGLGAQADVLRAVATRAGLLAGALEWRSAGAHGFDDQVAALVGGLRAAADRLDTLPQLAAGAAPSRFPGGAPHWPGGP
jgi:hypothetical protein